MNNNLQPLLNSLLNACTQISELLRQGNTDIDNKSKRLPSANSSGEQQKPLDIIANEIIKNHLSKCADVFALSSEEEDNALLINALGDYLVSFDPLDGSSNIDVNMCVGTIFSILKKQPQSQETDDHLNHQFLQKGREQVAAGFVVYGPATTAIIGINPHFDTHIEAHSQAHSLTELRLDNGQWQSSDTHLHCPTATAEYAINTANYPLWHSPIRQYIEECWQGEQGQRGKNFNMRWLGSMVADMYRIFKRGGVFIYPGDSRHPNGKIRLLYEANPMSLIAELIGGGSTNGKCSILDIPITDIHQKTPVMIGSQEEIKRIDYWHQHSL